MTSLCHCTNLRVATRKLCAAYDAALAPLGINIAQFSLLRAVERGQPVSLTALGQSQALDRSTVGRNVRVLDRMGLVLTERGQDDRREASVRLTAAGADLLTRALPIWAGCQADSERRLGSAAVATLEAILATI